MSDIHRLLDEAFAGVVMTPDLQDLKEELRGNLASRVEELDAKGTGSAKAAAQAVAELDIPQLIAGIEAEPGRATTPGARAAEAARLHRVRPRPAFVVRASVLSVTLLACVLHIVVDLVTQPSEDGTLDAQLWTVGFGVLLAALIADSLHQETSTRYPMPVLRSIRWGLVSGFLATGIGYVVLFLWHQAALGLLAAGIILALAGVMAMIALGVTQTNRLKPWALAQARQYEAEDRFSQDPAAAARFGLFTVVIWTLAITAFVVLSITVGFAWSWLAIVGGFVVFFLVLAKMLFPVDKGSQPQG
jgi:hypothetical protein